MKMKEGMTLSELISAAEQEQWETIDELLPHVADNPEYIQWAKTEGLTNQDDNIRDLAVSILELTTSDFEPDLHEKLLVLMRTDPNIYVQFRAAFALFSHSQRDEEVILKIKEARNDSDVSEIANRYLTQLES